MNHLVTWTLEPSAVLPCAEARPSNVQPHSVSNVRVVRPAMFEALENCKDVSTETAGETGDLERVMGERGRW